VVFDLLHETAYPNSGLGRTILGPVENIKSISRANLESYIKTHYTGPRIVVAGAGAVEHGALSSLADAAFGSLPSARLAPAPAPPAFQGSQLTLRNDDLGLAYLAIGFETGGWTHPHAFPLMVLQTLLGSWERTMGAGPNSASALCRLVGSKNLAHSMSCFNSTYTDTGLFGVYAVTDPTNVWELSSEILYEMVRLCHNVSDEEVARAKTQLKTHLLGGLDGTTAIFEDIGRQVLTYGRRMTPAEVVARVDAVDAAAVQAAARAYVDDKEVVTAGAGFCYEMPDANWCVPIPPPVPPHPQHHAPAVVRENPRTPSAAPFHNTHAQRSPARSSRRYRSRTYTLGR
jgi:processing peptidase subunit beta